MNHLFVEHSLVFVMVHLQLCDCKCSRFPEGAITGGYLHLNSCLKDGYIHESNDLDAKITEFILSDQCSPAHASVPALENSSVCVWIGGVSFSRNPVPARRCGLGPAMQLPRQHLCPPTRCLSSDPEIEFPGRHARTLGQTTSQTPSGCTRHNPTDCGSVPPAD